VYCCILLQVPLIYVTLQKVRVDVYHTCPRQINLSRYGRKHRRPFFLIIIFIIFIIFFSGFLFIIINFFYFYGVTAQYRALAYCSSGFKIGDVL